MPLHVETLFFAAIAIRAAFVVIFVAAAYKRRKQTYLLHWFASPAVTLAALLCLFMHQPFSAMPVLEGALVAGLMGLGFALLWSGLRDFLGKPQGWGRIVLQGLTPALVYGLLHNPGDASLAWAGSLLVLALLAAWPMADLLPAFLRDRHSSQFFVLVALFYYVIAFSTVAVCAGLGFTEARISQIVTLLFAADCFFSLLLLVDLLAMTGERARRSLRNLATTDTLTGLLNRRGVLEIADKALARLAGRQHSTCVVIADIDHFKAVNDQLGHDAGDVVLAEFARRCRGVIQRRGDLAARWGGEEFVMILPETTPDEAVAQAEKLREAIAAAPFKVFGVVRSVTVSAGVAWIESGETSVELSIGRADVALYRAKQGGRNMVCLAKEPEQPPSCHPANDQSPPLQPSVEPENPVMFEPVRRLAATIS